MMSLSRCHVAILINILQVTGVLRGRDSPKGDVRRKMSQSIKANVVHLSVLSSGREGALRRRKEGINQSSIEVFLHSPQSHLPALSPPSIITTDITNVPLIRGRKESYEETKFTLCLFTTSILAKLFPSSSETQ